METKAKITKEILLPWLKMMKIMYEEKGLIPTLDLLIEDIEEDNV